MDAGRLGKLNRVGQVWHVKVGSYPGIVLIVESGVRDSSIVQHRCLLLDADRPRLDFFPGALHTFYEEPKRPWDSFGFGTEEIERLA